MLPGQIMPGQMSPWRLESVLDVPRNLLPLKFGQNRGSNTWDVTDIEFLWWVGGGVGCTVIFKSNPTARLRLRLGFDKMKFSVFATCTVFCSPLFIIIFIFGVKDFFHEMFLKLFISKVLPILKYMTLYGLFQFSTYIFSKLSGRDPESLW